MSNGRYVDKDTIIKRVQQYYGLTIFGEDVNDFIYDGMRALGGFKHLELKSTNGEDGNPDVIEVTNYRGILPVDIEYPIHAYDKDTLEPMLCVDSIYKNNYSAYLLDTSQSLESSGDNYTSQETDPYLRYPSSAAHPTKTYRLKKHHIFTSDKELNVILIYLGFPLDGQGNPIVLDEEHTLQAITAYVAKSIALPMLIKGQISGNIYDRIEQDYYVHAASVPAVDIPHEDEMEAIRNDFLSLLPDTSHFQDNFKYFGQKVKLDIR